MNKMEPAKYRPKHMTQPKNDTKHYSMVDTALQSLHFGLARTLPDRGHSLVSEVRCCVGVSFAVVGGHFLVSQSRV